MRAKRQPCWPLSNSAAARRWTRCCPRSKRIVSDVRKGGDRALLRYAAKFDRLAGPKALRVTQKEMAAAWKALDPALRDALTTAAKQIRGFAKLQLPKSWNKSTVEGLTTGQLVRPLQSVGCYVPSGRHPLPSTLLMTAIPAQVAGVKRIVVVSPKPAPETLAAAHLLRDYGVLSARRRARSGRTRLWNQ